MSAGLMEKPGTAERGSGESVPRPKVVPSVRTFRYRRLNPRGEGLPVIGNEQGVLGHYLTYTVAGGAYVEESVHTQNRGVQLVVRLSLAPGTWYDIVETLDEDLSH